MQNFGIAVAICILKMAAEMFSETLVNTQHSMRLTPEYLSYYTELKLWKRKDKGDGLVWDYRKYVVWE
jgi:hypothetical protein